MDRWGPDQLLTVAMQARREAGLLRRRREVRHLDDAQVEVEGQRYVDFSSNDYLGLTHHPAVSHAAAAATRAGGAGSGASALVTGYTQRHASAERALATWKGTERAVLLPSGYQANHAAVQTFAGAAQTAARPLRFLVDKLVHASLIDAVRASQLPMRVFPHNGIDKLARLLTSAPESELQVVVTESIFSMDGDPADLVAITQLKKIRPFALVLDEAHGSGVYGTDGAGYAAELRIAEQVDVFVVTLSKALGGMGGAVCATQIFCEALVNFGRAYVYSTCVPPALAAAAEAALGVIRDEPHRQQRVRALSLRVRAAVSDLGLATRSGDSPIIPIVLSTELAALSAAQRLMEQGLLVAAMRPPTVPRGTSRLRVTLSSEHTDEQIAALISGLAQLVEIAGRRLIAEV